MLRNVHLETKEVLANFLGNLMLCFFAKQQCYFTNQQMARACQFCAKLAFRLVLFGLTAKRIRKEIYLQQSCNLVWIFPFSGQRFKHLRPMHDSQTEVKGVQGHCSSSCKLQRMYTGTIP